MSTTTERVDAAVIIARLADICPQCIFVYEKRRRALKVGIYSDIAAAVGDAITPDELGAALRAYTRNVGYLTAMARGGARIGLDGQPAGEITPDQMAGAAKGAASHWARQAKRKAARRAEERPPCSSAAGGSVSVKPRRLGLSDLRAAAQARRVAS